MKSILFTLAGLIIGIALMIAGVYYLKKDMSDKDAVKIYGTFIAIGAVITFGLVIKIIIVRL